MAYSDFTFPDVLSDLGLTLEETRLFPAIPSEALCPDFQRRLNAGARLATLINTEKGRSEFIVAPLLLELQLTGTIVSLFSGVELKADPKAGLTGFCDFLLAQSPLQSVLTAPLISVVEAKNDNLRNGYGQCIAEMVAMQIVNAAAGYEKIVYGIVTTGSLWQFLRLTRALVELDIREYSLTEADEILPTLRHILETE